MKQNLVVVRGILSNGDEIVQYANSIEDIYGVLSPGQRFLANRGQQTWVDQDGSEVVIFPKREKDGGRPLTDIFLEGLDF